MYLEYNYCDECGRECDGVHSGRKSSIDDQIEQIMKLITSQSYNIVKEVLKRLQDYTDNKKIG